MIGGPCATCGGLLAEISAPHAGDYCDEYRLPVFSTTTTTDLGQDTGFSPNSPQQRHQQTDGKSPQSSACQAESDT
ncbi:MAG: hypothetical protein ACRDQZ_13645, partial [Mycobacteriales bacterium]